jgi:hypothetical protein
MYRQAGDRAADAPDASFTYDGVTRGGSAMPGIAALQTAILLPLGLSAVAAAAVSPTAGLVALVGSAPAAFWWARRKNKNKANVVLRVENGDVVVSNRGGETRTCIALRELRDVALDTRTIQPIQEGGSAIPAVRITEGRVGPDVDLARIVLVRRDGTEVPLTKEHGSYMDAIEWLGRMRVFLRSHGWVPADESDDAEGEEEEDEEDDEDAVAPRVRVAHERAVAEEEAAAEDDPVIDAPAGRPDRIS